MLRFLFILALIVHIGSAVAQNSTVTGIVTSSEDGLPLTGVAVLDKQTMKGSATNVDGRFTLSISPRSKTLQFSYVGYKTIEVDISNAGLGDISVVMDPDLVSMDEVIVVAYGTSKKSTFTGSASVVKSEQLEKIKTSNISQALQGQSSGVQVINNSGNPGDEAIIRIRGIGSVNASSAPLYVVDGVAYDGYINAISPNDIENITVLKDASATALYGSRAANGVILITTKSGQSEAAQVNFRSTWSYSALAVDLPRQLTPQEFAELTWRALKNGRMDDAGVSEAEAAQFATTNLINELKINPFSIRTPVATNGKMDPAAALLFSGDWRKALFASNPRQEYTLDVNGKSGKSDYFVSGSYLSDRGIFSIQEFKRYNIRANVNFQAKDWLKIGSNISLAESWNNMSVGSSTVWFLRTIATNNPIYEWDYEKGEYKTDSNGNKIYDYGDDRAAWAGWNPLADNAYNSSPTTVDNVSSRSYIELIFLPGLKFRTNFSVDLYLSVNDGYVNSEYGYAAGYGGEAYKSYSRNFSYTLNNLLTYDKSFGDHQLSVLLGQEAYLTRYKYLSASKRGFPFAGLTEISAASEMNSMGSSEENYRLLSYLSRLEYDYADKYYISGSFRSDGSSRFHPNTRWGYFWSVGASWRISNEEFLKENESINNLKIRASYGSVGNDALSTYYAYQGLYASGQNDYTDPGVLISRLPNEILKWESNIQTNVALDFALFNRFSGSIEWFRRDSKDLLFPMPLAPSSGFSSIDRNIGDVKNEGFEFELNFIPVNSKDFRWSIDLNGTSYKNIITKLPQEEMNSGYFKWREGQSRYNYFMVEYAGVNPETGNDQYWETIFERDNNGQLIYDSEGNKIIKGREKTEDLNALTADEQKRYVGDALPKLFGGFTNSFSYKGIDASVMLYYSIGGKLYDTDYSQMMSFRTGFSFHPDMLESWTTDNTDAKFPRLSTAYATTLNGHSTKFLFDNTFMRLRNVTLGYTLPKSITRQALINSLRIFVQGDNILTTGSAAKRGTDPEQSIGGDTGNRFPVTKSFSFGLQLSF